MCSDQAKKQIFENYPAGVVVAANLLSAIIYILGAAIILQINLWAMLLYLAFCLSLEFKLMATGCVHCYYFGRLCFSGKGVVSSWFFKPGDPKKFTAREISWLALLPDMLVVFVPVAIGIFFMFWEFKGSMLMLVVGLLIVAFPGQGFIRGALACCYCRQRELGCPAEKLFKKS
ncbi:hypothetical protein KAR34_06305 [bacterium]|nr:hypothetical protein [bacterium]